MKFRIDIPLLLIYLLTVVEALLETRKRNEHSYSNVPSSHRISLQAQLFTTSWCLVLYEGCHHAMVPVSHVARRCLYATSVCGINDCAVATKGANNNVHKNLG
jgi:hypothetical protein